MLREILISLRTRCAPAFAALGYRYAAVACVGRAQRCAAAWAPHQENTKRRLLAAMAEAPAGSNTAVILGSGPCLDLPMAELLARFSRVLLVDVAHPPDARHLARRHAGIELVEMDLTGTALSLADRAAAQVPTPNCNAFVDEPGLGLVVSANLISQLPLVPLRHAQRRWPDADLGGFARSIVMAHLDHLARFTCPTLLVGDMQRRIVDPDGKVTEWEDPLFGANLPAGEAEWEWTVAPVGELSGGWSIVNRVRAVRMDRRLPTASGYGGP
ncbi:hypothetical protein [Niveispirillum fermenti]|uniref:hypothetical protein n=1 Tax=Niveispirillum fermenti TaxID=1233113 RepID=UPI003A8C7AFC